MPARTTVRCAALTTVALLALVTPAVASSPGTSYIFPAGAQGRADGLLRGSPDPDAGVPGR